MSIFEEIGKSVYSPDYYKKVGAEKFSASLSYFISLALVVSLIVTAIATFRVLPLLKTAINNFKPQILEHFPEDLVVTVKDGVVATNSEDPVVISLQVAATSTTKATTTKVVLASTTFPANFLVINTSSSFDETTFKNANTLLYLTKDTIHIARDDGSIERSEKLEIPDFTLDRPTIINWLSEFESVVPWIPFILVFAIFFSSLAVISLAFIELLLAALFIMFAARFKGMPLKYGQAYKYGLHAVTFHILLGISVVSGPGILAMLVFFPFMGILFTLLIFWINVLAAKENKSPHLVENEK
ncbi:MAG: DUF1189 family protein [Patescibacteria group bacterium]